MAGIPSGEIRVEYNDRYDEWDIDSAAPLWLHTAAPTREDALRLARKKNDGNHTIKVKGPRMNQFKTA